MKQFLYVLVFVLLASCTSNTIYKEPKNLIPRDSMVLLLTDMYIANASRFEKNKKLQKDLNYVALVYEKYKIDSTRFATSNIFYTSQIETYDLLLKDVKRNIDKLRTIYKDSLKIQDSLRLKERKDKIQKLQDKANPGREEETKTKN